MKYKPYHFSLLLLLSVLLGSLVGFGVGPKVIILKPLGDIFLNLMFMVVVPLVFFSVTSAVSALGELKRAWKIILNMLGVFIFTSTIAAIFMLIVVHIFPLNQTMILPLAVAIKNNPINFANQLVSIFTVPDFINLFSRDNMLALIFFSLLVGLATVSLKEKGALLAAFFQAGQEVSMRLVSFVMYYAPIGFFAYFAVLVGTLGSKLLEVYLRATVIYSLAALVYFVFGLTIYAYLSSKSRGIKVIWKNIYFPAITALATCSSAATIPANLTATRNMGVPAQISELVIPLGSVIHKDGSVLGGIVKIAFLFGVFHMNFAAPSVIGLAVIVAVLVGTVMGAIPSGGMVGEMLILSVYGFPSQTLIIIAAISILIDPLATMLNATSNTACSMLVARLVEGKHWLKEKYAYAYS